MSEINCAGQRSEAICFVIGRPRSGTTVLKQMLATHPKVYSCDEIFSESNGRSYVCFLQQKAATDLSAVLPSRSLANFLEYIKWCKNIAAEDKPSAELLVFDMKYDQSHLIYDAWQAMGTVPKIFQMLKEKQWRAHRRPPTRFDRNGPVEPGRHTDRSLSHRSRNKPGAKYRNKPGEKYRNKPGAKYKNTT